MNVPNSSLNTLCAHLGTVYWPEEYLYKLYVVHLVCTIHLYTLYTCFVHLFCTLCTLFLYTVYTCFVHSVHLFCTLILYTYIIHTGAACWPLCLYTCTVNLYTCFVHLFCTLVLYTQGQPVEHFVCTLFFNTMNWKDENCVCSMK